MLGNAASTTARKARMIRELEQFGFTANGMTTKARDAVAASSGEIRKLWAQANSPADPLTPRTSNR